MYEASVFYKSQRQATEVHLWEDVKVSFTFRLVISYYYLFPDIFTISK